MFQNPGKASLSGDVVRLHEAVAAAKTLHQRGFEACDSAVADANGVLAHCKTTIGADYALENIVALQAKYPTSNPEALSALALEMSNTLKKKGWKNSWGLPRYLEALLQSMGPVEKTSVDATFVADGAAPSKA